MRGNKKRKRRKFKSICFIVLVLIIGGCIGYYFYMNDYINKSLTKLYKVIDSYENDNALLTTGKLYDLSKDEIKYDGVKPSEGQIFVDVDHKIKAISNIKINNRYCIIMDNKFYCSYKFDAKTNTSSDLYDKYRIGDEVTLLDGSSWHVIHDSSEYSKYVTLIKDTRVDINKDGFLLTVGRLDDPDYISFSTDGDLKYDTSNQTNIGYYVENIYKNSLSYNVFEVRLPEEDEMSKLFANLHYPQISPSAVGNITSTANNILSGLVFPNDYEKLGGIKFDEEQLKILVPHYLFNMLSGDYWISPSGDKTLTAAWNDSTFNYVDANSKASLKPVITVSKENIKK